MAGKRRAPPPEPPADIDDEQLDAEAAGLLDAGERDDEPIEREGPVEVEAGPLSDAECSRALRADAFRRFKRQLERPPRSKWVMSWRD